MLIFSHVEKQRILTFDPSFSLKSSHSSTLNNFSQSPKAPIIFDDLIYPQPPSAVVPIDRADFCGCYPMIFLWLPPYIFKICG